jgi:hypothetical protein
MSHNPPPTQPPWGQPPQPVGPDPYTSPTPPARRPGWTRKRIIIPAAVVLFFVGVGMGAADDGATTEKSATGTPTAAPTVTVTATATATASAEPGPAVTETVTARAKPVPAVTKTVTVKVTTAPDSGGSEPDDDGGGEATYYANCSAVRAAGAAPIRTGDPGYDSHLDRDGDGVACE